MLLPPLLTLAVLLAAAPPDEPVTTRYEALSKEHNDRMAAFFKAYFATEDAAKRTEISRTMHPDDAAYATRFLALANEDPTGVVTPDALYWVLQLQHDRLQPTGRQALDRMARNYATSPRMGEFLQQMALHPWPGMEELLRDVLARNPDRSSRGMACFGLAGMMAGHAAIPKLANDPEMAATFDRMHGPDVMAAILKRDHESDHAEAVALHRRVVAEFANVPLFPADPKDPRTLGPFAQRWLDNQDEVGIGKTAPEIEGRDVDGKPFKLRDFRGKVVVVVFWASWCGPCMAQIPHERELVGRMAGRPFALLGVNCDHSPADARKALDRERITWPNWYDGDPSAARRNDGPIRDKYHIQGIPAVFVIDQAGIIRDRDVRGVELERAVERLLTQPAP